MSSIDAFPPGNRPQSAVETVVDTIRRLLAERRLGPGDLLPSENEIASTLAISRGSIREAMKILEAFGVVEIRRGDGTYVASPAEDRLFDPPLFELLVSSRDIRELAELRSLVEEGIVRLIADKAGEVDFSAIEEICDDMAGIERMRDGSDGSTDAGNTDSAMLDIDRRYHAELGRLTRNRLVSRVYGFVIRLLAPTMSPGFGAGIHIRLVRALRSRDAGLALDMVREHDDVWRFLNGWSPENPEPESPEAGAKAEA